MLSCKGEENRGGEEERVIYRALVVEDDEDLRELLAEVLSMHDYEVTVTPSGREAIVLAGQRPFDIVFLDLDLEELSGTAVVRVVRDLERLPVIVLSGRSDDDWQRELLEAGATACFSKPYALQDLLDLSAQILRLETPQEAGWPTDVRSLSPHDLARVRELTDDEVDRLPFGAICLDEAGRIMRFNSYEQSASSYAANAVIGQRFEDVAPCTRVQEFSRHVEAGLRGEPLDEVIRFIFPRFGSQCVVSVRLFRDPPHEGVWIFVSKWRATE